MTSRKSLLKSLLRTLVEEWGHKAVEDALTQDSDSAGRTDAHLHASGRPEGIQRRRSATKLLAIEQVARAQFPKTQEVALRELAMRFDRKQFLPTVSDVREFLVMMGEQPGAMKDRAEAFRRLLKALSGLPPERLERLANSALHSGPSQLGPLSDAISAAAVTLPRRREPNAS
jgi:hypothetical protein